MPAMSPRLRQAQPPVVLPHVWRGEALAGAGGAVLPSGHAALDAQLPGGGWPLGAMVELLQPQPQAPVWQLLLPGLARQLREQAGPAVLVGPPCEPFGPSLRAQGLPGERLLWVRSEPPAARLWAAEQALRCAEVSAVLAWLPQARSAELRRLQLAAQQQGRLLFVLRGAQARHEASPAPLRLWLEGWDSLEVHILKRRGPPLEAPVRLPAQAPRVAALLAAWRLREAAGEEAGHGLGRPVAARA
ncbi:translesion DNA synthesis-associated protein ImuA [Ramlibacter sp. 2FC]|uniref:translesion DNA synthesis-associated protein ImuA n=1 Tax=Ramlibacter sp. 2FC TaxID=2502188 RepID=UPI00201E5583|nr:translesion DNA synthesis-associated protein ImuA [Ramlibacter sp. 2FC]